MSESFSHELVDQCIGYEMPRRDTLASAVAQRRSEPDRVSKQRAGRDVRDAQRPGYAERLRSLSRPRRAHDEQVHLNRRCLRCSRCGVDRLRAAAPTPCRVLRASTNADRPPRGTTALARSAATRERRMGSGSARACGGRSRHLPDARVCTQQAQQLSELLLDRQQRVHLCGSERLVGRQDGVVLRVDERPFGCISMHAHAARVVRRRRMRSRPERPASRSRAGASDGASMSCPAEKTFKACNALVAAKSSECWLSLASRSLRVVASRCSRRRLRRRGARRRGGSALGVRSRNCARARERCRGVS